MPEDDADLVGKEAWVTGWGRLYEGKKRKLEIRNVIVIVIVIVMMT